ncbi:hypothetical protein ABIB95_009200 [Bradyrhizobium sp. LA2.1]
MLAARRPFQRPQAGLSDLSARHLGGHGIAEPGPCLARRRRCRRRREVQPFGGLDDIPRHALSFFGGLLWRRATARGAIGGMPRS